MADTVLSHFQLEHMSVADRISAGKELRKKNPRAEEGKSLSAVSRADPISILEAAGQNQASGHGTYPICKLITQRKTTGLEGLKSQRQICKI